MTDPTFDRFSLPGEIPDAADPCWREEEEARGYSASHPAGRGWTPLSRNLGIPGERAVASVEHGGVEHVFPEGMPDDVVAAIGCGQVFTLERRARFLDHLAFQGNVRAAAASVSVSHETAYRARRQDAQFARLWDAAMVHARSYCEAQLATRAYEGVEVAIVVKGEIVGYRTVKDSRLLLAHMARLDKRAEADSEEARAARATAERFDELLAGYAGHAMPDGFAEAAEEAQAPMERGEGAPALPPTRQDYVIYRRSQEVGAGSSKTEARRMQAAGEAAGREWDGWRGGALARVGGIVGGIVGGEADAADRVTSVNPACETASPPERRRPRSGARKRAHALLQTASGAAIQSPYSAGAIG